jgi:hypothetical protein
MDFKEYCKKIDCKLFYKTEQSEIFLTENNTLCKVYFKREDKDNESFFYDFFIGNGLIKTPNIYSIGMDYVEIELLNEERKFDLINSINELSNLYNNTEGIKLAVKRIDLSKEKLYHRLGYLKEEIKKRDIPGQILEKAKKFVDEKYLSPKEECIIHGDLKSIHIINTKGGIKFIDFALSGIANPWYDLAFLIMEEQENKKNIFEDIANYSYPLLRKRFGSDKEKNSNYLRSSIFYRTLYSLGFALRHRPQKSLDRIIKELNQIIDTEI